MKSNRKHVVALILFSVTLLLIRAALTQTITYGFLGWNLVLSGIPLLISHQIIKCQPSRPKLIALSIPWLLFLPNAPYILTDFLHFRRVNSMPEWFDLLLLATFSATGLLLGLISMIQMQKVWRDKWGTKVADGMISGCAILAGFGIYIGRFERYNSWDVLSNPIALLSDAASLTTNVHTVGFTLGYGTLILLLFFAFKSTEQSIN